ncbi:MAG: DUF2203 domain-containing protein [Planctomycetota bacterium]
MQTLQRPKLFDLETANKAIPLVSRIVQDIVRAHAEMTSLHASAQDRAGKGDAQAAEELQDKHQAVRFELSEFIDELERVGCELKDPVRGLIDFPSRHEDRVVYLCWMLGEDSVNHWHELDAGFAGRQSTDGFEFSS